MSTHRARLPLAPATREALVEALKLKLPPGQPLTIDALEAATGHLLSELGPQLMEDVIHGVEDAPKKGALPSAAGSPRRSKGAKPAR